MKKMLMILFVGSLLMSTTFLLASETPQVPTVKLFISNPRPLYQNGDVISIIGSGFPMDAVIKTVLLDVYNADGTTAIKFQKNDNLQIDLDGKLYGDIVLEGIETDDRLGQISIFATGVNVYATDRFEIKGDLEPTFPGLPEGTSFDFTEAGGDNIVQLGELLTISASSSDWTGVLGTRRYEYDASHSFIQFLSMGLGNITVNGSGQLTGTITNDTTAYASNTNYMKLWVIDDDLTSAYSTTEYSTIDNIAPNLSSAVATDLTHITLTFDEAVSQVGNAANLFTFSGTDAGSITISSIAAGGTEPVDTWTLTLSTGFSKRNVGDVKIAYSHNGTDSLKDASNNEVANTSPAITVTDNIPPATPTLTNPTTSTVMTGAGVTLQATADDATTDPSMSGVTFQGSADSSSWTDLGQDNVTTDGTYSYSYTFGTKYAYYRAVARDDGASLTTPSPGVGDLTDAHMVGLPTYPASLDVGVRGEFIAAIENNYGDSVTYQFPVALTFNLATSQPSTGTFYNAASGGSSITSIVIGSGKKRKSFWYADLQPSSTPTDTVTESGGNLDVSSVNQQITILSVPFDHFHITTEHSGTETAGTAFSITVEAHNSSHAIVTGVVGNYNLTWSTSATASPDGTSPNTPADGTYSFTSGSLTVSSNTLYNSAETPYIRVTDGTHSTANLDAGASITVNDASTYQARVKTAADTGEEQYAANVYGAASFQGPTQASPDKSTTLYGVVYDSYGNLVTAADAGTWSKDAALLGTFSGTTGSNTTLTFDDTGGTGTTYSGTVSFTSTGTYGNVVGSSGTIEVDDYAPDQVNNLTIFTDDVNNQFVYSFWGTNSGDDGGTGTVTDYDIRWATEASGQIDSEAKWSAATSVGTTGKPLYSIGSWHIDMSSFPSGNKYFAIRTTDDVGNQSPIKYTTTTDFSLPVTLTAFTATGGYGKIELAWETASEIDNEGFFLYRATEQDGNFVQIHSQIIPGNGNSNTTNSYSYEDSDVQEDVTYYYKLYSRDFNGTMHVNGGIVSATVLPLPKEFRLAQNYPNPFNPTTNIRFELAKASTVDLAVYNMLGQKIRTLLNNEPLQPGVYEGIIWDAQDENGRLVSNGIYYLVFAAKDQNVRQVRKIVYMK